MSFGGSGGGGGSIATGSDVALSSPTNGQVLTYNTTLGKWQNANAAGGGGAVSSVAGRTGAIVLAASDVSGVLAASNNLSDLASVPTALTNLGLNNVNNTSDAGKPISTATQTALNAKEPTVTAGTTGQYYRGDKTWQTLNSAAVGLGNVNNTADTDKPISTAVQTALTAKADATTVGTKVLLIDNAGALPTGTPAGVVVVVKSS